LVALHCIGVFYFNIAGYPMDSLCFLILHKCTLMIHFWIFYPQTLEGMNQNKRHVKFVLITLCIV